MFQPRNDYLISLVPKRTPLRLPRDPQAEIERESCDAAGTLKKHINWDLDHRLAYDV